LAVANSNSGVVSTLKNNGDGTFQWPVAVGGTAANDPRSVFCADLDGDGDLDLAVAHAFLSKIFVWKNNGDGTFQSVGNFGAEGAYSVFCADLDGDNDLDIAATNYGDFNVSVFKNNGDGTFESAVNYGARRGPYSVFCADLDRDGDKDLAVANYLGGTVSVLINRTNTSFVEQEVGQSKVNSFSLSQNYPNPFNISTKIEFVLSKSGFVTLTIYDILGRKVRTLTSEHMSLGYKSVLWDGKNDSGNEVGSGIYFYQLRVGDLSESKKLVLLK